MSSRPVLQSNIFLRTVQRLRRALPQGRALPEQIWRRRHRVFLAFLLGHALGLAILSSVTGHTTMFSLGVGTWITLFALLGAIPYWSRKLRASWVSLGFVTSSALLVHLSGGYIEMHFHYFVMVTFLALYQDWTPFLLAVGYVIFQHGLGGLYFPQTVYNHPDAWAHPWKWAFIHAGFLASACIGVIIAWRANESGRARIENLLNSTVEGFLGLDRQGRIIFANRAIEELTGYTVSELTGRPMDVLFLDRLRPDPSGSQQSISAIRSALGSTNEIYVREAMCHRRDGGRRIVECRTSPLRDELELSGIVLTLTDITERDRMQRQAAQVSRLATLGQLMSGIAHELKNPLFVLSGHLQLAKEKLEAQEYDTLPNDLQQIEGASKRMTQITERFLRLARPELPRQERCSVQRILEEMMRFLGNELMKSQIRVVTSFSPEVPEIWSDPRLLQEAFVNLVLNAMQAIVSAHGQGTLTVTTALVEGWVEVRIQDDGPGILPEHRTQIFNPFFSTKPPGEGAGLGLWIVRSTLMKLKGTIEVETDVGRGTTFVLKLPSNDGSQAEHAA